MTPERPAQATHSPAVPRTSSSGRLGAALRDGLHRLSRAGSRRSSRRASASEAGGGISDGQGLPSTAGLPAEALQAAAGDAAGAAEGHPTGLQAAATGGQRGAAWQHLGQGMPVRGREPAPKKERKHSRRLQFGCWMRSQRGAAEGPLPGSCRSYQWWATWQQLNRASV